MKRLKPVFAVLCLVTMSGVTSAAEVSLSNMFAITKPVGGREFLNPQSVYVDRKRNEVYVADTGNGRIVIVTKDGYSTGGFPHRADGVPEGSSSEPVGVAVDGKGRILVTDGLSSCIYVYDFRGRITERLKVKGLGDEPPSFGKMTVDSKNNIYVVVRNMGTVCVISPEGKLIKTVGSRGTGEGRFRMLADVAVDSGGNIYALDTLGTTVQVFNPEGKRILAFGVHATGRGNFAHPAAIEVDSKGRIWVIDSFAQVVNVYDPKGKFITDFGGFFIPTDLAFLQNPGSLYILEKNGRRLFGFTMN